MLKFGAQRRAFAGLNRLKSAVEATGGKVAAVHRKRKALEATIGLKRRELIGCRDPTDQLADIERVQAELHSQARILANTLADLQTVLQPLDQLVDVIVLDILSWGVESLAQALDGAVRVKNAIKPGSAALDPFSLLDPTDPSRWLVRHGLVTMADGRTVPISGTAARDPAIAKLTETLAAIRTVVDAIGSAATQRP